jgi:hypothetical protein
VVYPGQKAKGKRQKAKGNTSLVAFIFGFLFYSRLPRTQYSSKSPFMASPMPS